jgi:hypothetical protein
VPSVPDPTDRLAADAFTTHRGGYGPESEKLERLLQYLARHPHATLPSGDGGMLAAEIHRLRAELARVHPADGAGGASPMR